MDITATVEERGPARRLLRIEVSGADVSRELGKVYAEYGKRARIPGFRQGKVPREILELRFAGEAEKKVLERLVPKALAESIGQKGLKVAGDPALVGELRVRKGEPLCFEVEVDLHPEFELSTYRGIKVKKKEVTVAEEEVDRELTVLRERAAQLAEVEGRSLQMGDFAIMDLEETLPGGEVSARKSIRVEMNEERFIPGFCASLEGMKPGEEREFTLRVPDDHHVKELAGRENSFKVKLHEIKEKVLPELDDEFARGFGDFENLDGLRGAIGKGIREQRELEARREVEEQLVDELIRKNRFDLPRSLVDSHSRSLFDGRRAQLRKLGIEVEPESEKGREYRSRAREAAERNLRWMYIRNKIAEKESIEVDDDELNGRIDAIARNENRSEGQVRARLEEEGRLEGLREMIKGEKVLSFLLDQAKIK